MFKKSIKLGAQNQLSGKDKKGIKNKLVKYFDEESVEKFLARSDKIVCHKVAGSRMLIYVGEEYPLFVDQTGKQEYFPSLYLTAAYEPLTKSLIIAQGVQEFIFNGANLMWPGVRDISQIGEFKKNQIVSVKSWEGEYVGVGMMGCSIQELRNNVDGSGIAVQMLHYRGDKLWDMGSKTYPEVMLKAREIKVVQSEVKPQIAEEVIEQKQQQIITNEVKQEKLLTLAFVQSEEDIRKKKKTNKKGKKQICQSDSDDDQNNKRSKKGKFRKEKKKQLEQIEEIQKKEPVKQEEHQQNHAEMEPKQETRNMSADKMDQYFKETFLNAIKLSKIQQELPIDAGRFFSEFMLMAREEGLILQIKDSSYKKLSKFYEEMSRLKLIEFKVSKDKKGQTSVISKIYWQNQTIKNYKPTIINLIEKEVEQKQESGSVLKLSKTLRIQTVFKVNEQLKKILFKKVINYMPDHSDEQDNKQDEKKDIFLSQKELKQKIEKYINQSVVKAKIEGQMKGEGKEKKYVEKMVTIDYKRNEFLHKLLKREIMEYEQNLIHEKIMAPENSDEDQRKKDTKTDKLFKIERSAIITKMSKMTVPHYSMYDPETNLCKFKEGNFKGILLTGEKVTNKNVTKISGLQTFISQSDEIAHQINGFSHYLQLKYASSSSVIPLARNCRQITLQGNFIEQIEQLLTSQLGIKKEYITINNKLGKKRRS